MIETLSCIYIWGCFISFGTILSIDTFSKESFKENLPPIIVATILSWIFIGFFIGQTLSDLSERK